MQKSSIITVVSFIVAPVLAIAYWEFGDAFIPLIFILVLLAPPVGFAVILDRYISSRRSPQHPSMIQTGVQDRSEETDIVDPAKTIKPLFDPEKLSIVASYVCLLGSFLNPLVYFLLLRIGRSSQVLGSFIFMQLVVQFFLILLGIVALRNLPKKRRREIKFQSIAGIALCVVLGFGMILLLIVEVIAGSKC